MPRNHALTWYKSDGTKVAAGGTLAANTTYFARVFIDDATLWSFTVAWDAAIVVTLTVEGTDHAGLSLYGNDARWIDQSAIADIVVAGGSAGTDQRQAPSWSPLEARIKAVVGATGGVLTGDQTLWAEPVTVGQVGPLAAPFASFAGFDPRSDGLDAPLGSIWAALDCPMRQVKVGTDDTDWLLDGPGEAIFAACSSAAEVNALYRGLARQPTLDFTPAHVLIPDYDNDRLTDVVAGYHLTKQGLGSGASITRSPLGGWQAEVLAGNASYYQATDASYYAFTTEPFVVGVVMSTTRNAGGAVVLGKYADAALAGKGYGLSSNAAGHFGFLVNGAGSNLNSDSYDARVDDGRPRLFHFGRSTAGGGVGFVRTAGIPAVTVAGLAGSVATNVSTKFGLRNDNGAGTIVAAGDHQVQAIVVWSGTAAENLITYLATIERSLASAQRAVPNALLQDPQAATPARSLGVAFQPNALRPCWCSYTIEFGSGGQSTAYVTLKSDAANPPTTVRARSGGGVGVAIVTIHTGQLSFLVPAGWYVLLSQVDVAAGGTCTIREQVEVSL